MKLTKLDSFTRSLVSNAYPEYRGRRIFLEVSERALDCASYWDGGSRSYFRFANLASGQVSGQVPAQSAFDKKIEGIDKVTLPLGFACIERRFFCGHESITIHIRPENAAKFLTENSDAK